MTEKYVPPHARSAGGAEAGARSAGLGSGQTAVGEEEEEVAEGIEQGGPRERAMARRWVAPIASTSATGVSAVAGGAGRAARQERFDSDSDSDSDGWVTDDQCTRKPCFCTFFWIPEAACFLVFVFLVYLGVGWRRRVFP